MKEIRYRNFKDINGMLNIFTHVFGLKAMCKAKFVLGKARGKNYKKSKSDELNDYLSQGLPVACCLETDQRKMWGESFLNLINQSNDELHWKMIYEFYHSDMKMIKDFESEICDGPIVLCVGRNEIQRIKQFFEHYHSIGVKNFIFLDNDSNDGTREYLMQQPDTRVYSTSVQYTAQRKSAWQNRMVAECGVDRWYLYVDADEFFWFPHASEISISEYVDSLQNQRIYGIKTIMIEMYPKGVIGSDEYEKKDFIEQYRYYDGDNDSYTYNPDLNQVCGGVLARLLGQGDLLRTKTPLYYHTKDRFLIGSHHIYPLYDDIAFPFGGLLKHYKFLPGEADKINEAIKNGNYANNSYMYKKYVKFYEGDGVCAFCDFSKEWNNDSTNEFKIIKDLFR